MKVLKQLLEQRDAAAKELREIEAAIKNADGTERDLTPEEEQRSLKLLNDVDELDEQIRDETKREKRQARLSEARELVSRSSEPVDAKVVDEPMQYGVHSSGEHSYFADLIRLSMGPAMGGVDPAVGQRMATWSHQVEREIALDTKRGRESLVQLRGMDGIRTENGIQSQRRIEEIRDRGRSGLEAKEAEFRAGITTGGGATASASGGGGAAFVIPVFYEGDYAPYREAGRAFADQVNQRPLPPYGMTVYLPAVTGPAAVATQTLEGSGIAETDPTAGFISSGLITTAGQVTVTQQLLDRAGPNVQFDQILWDQLRRDYAPKWDTYVLKQALASAGAISFGTGWAFAAAPGTPSFVSKVAGAINAVETTAGTIMSPTHLFLQTSRWNFMEAVGALESSSGNLHPLIVPVANGPFNAFVTGNQDGSVPYEGSTGYKLLGLPIYKDLNIPTPGTGADQAIVGNLNEVYAYEGPLVPRVVPQTLAPNLAVLLQLYSYGTALVRYPNAVQAISGAGMASITF